MDVDEEPRRIGSIRIEGVLGRGGMGTVHVGWDETLERRVALKAIRARHADDGGARARFRREARVLSRLEHPNICRIHGYVEHDDGDYLVLEYVQGGTLTKHVAGGALEPKHKLAIAVQIAEALAAAHAQGIVHRDLKPDNVMITPAGVAKVLDFGLARAAAPADAAHADVDEPVVPGDEHPTVGDDSRATDARTGAGADASTPFALGGDTDAAEDTPLDLPDVTEAGDILGTPLFMSPEQARGKVVTTASDMYSFGLLLQVLWTGRAPYPKGLGVRGLVERARKGEAVPPDDLPSDLRRLVERLRDPAPAARATAVEALERLRAIQDRPRRLMRRAVAAALVLVAIGATVKYTLDLKHARGVAEDQRGAAEEARGVAEDQRRIADARRGQAEDLIGFMLGDLRPKLTAVGRLELLDDVADRALAYFDAVPEAELTTRELSVRAKALYQLGEVRVEQGRLAEAMPAFERAVALGRALVDRVPDDLEALVQLGYSHYWLASGHYFDGELGPALAQFIASRDVARELVRREPDNLEYRLELAAEESNIARVLQDRGDVEGARVVLRERLETVRRIAQSDPSRTDWQVELASSHLLLGVAEESAGDVAEALRHYRADLDIMTLLVARAPDDATFKERLGVSHSHLGGALEGVGEADAAAEHFAAHGAIGAALAEGDADNATFQDSLAVALHSTGISARDRGALDEALEPLQRAVEIHDALSARDRARRRWRVQLLEDRVELGRLHELRGEPDAALAEGAAACALGEELLDDRDDGRTRLALCKALLMRGRLLRTRGERDPARDAFERAHGLVAEQARATNHGRDLSPFAQALLHLGRAEEAAPVLDELDAQGYADPLLDAARAATGG